MSTPIADIYINERAFAVWHTDQQQQAYSELIKSISHTYSPKSILFNVSYAS